MARRKSGQRALCGYCGHIAATQDPIPPHCLLAKPYPPGLVTIPSCFHCNHTLAMDEEYFLALLTHIGTRRNLTAKIEDDGGGVLALREQESVHRVLRKIAFGLARQQQKKSPEWADVVPLGAFPSPVGDGRPQPRFLATHADRFRSNKWVHLQPGVFSYLLTKDPTSEQRRWCVMNFRDALWGVVQLPGTRGSGAHRYRQMDLFSE